VTDDFEDIINLPHHVSDKRPRMSMYERAAQFSPFAALTGYDDEIDETARLTDSFPGFTEDSAAELDSSFQMMLDSERPDVTVTYFVPDSYKSGGAFETYSGTFRFYDAGSGIVRFTDGTAIDAEMICRIEFISLSYP